MQRTVVLRLAISTILLIIMFKCSVDGCDFSTNDDQSLVRHERSQCKFQRTSLQDAIAAKRKRITEERGSGHTKKPSNPEHEKQRDRSKRRREERSGIITGGSPDVEEGSSQVSLSTPNLL